MMAMDDARVVLRGRLGNRTSELRPEPFAAPKGDDVDVLLAQPFTPRAFFVETAHGHRKLGAQPPHELDDEAFRAARIQAQNDL
jgi:hypothetical protein